MVVRDVVRVSAVVIRDESGALLTVRKRGTERFMLPGGKPEAGETASETALRECREEIGVDLSPDSLRFLGVFRAAAANEPDLDVEAHVFEHPLVGAVAPAAEIEQLRWLNSNERPLPTDLAPLLAEQILPVMADLVV